MYDDGYDTDDTDELLASKCSFQSTVVVCSRPQQKASGGCAANQNGPAEECTIVEDEDWLFSISASSSRPTSAGLQPIPAKQKQQAMCFNPHNKEAQAQVELSRNVPGKKSELPTAGSNQIAESRSSSALDKPGTDKGIRVGVVLPLRR